MSRLTVAVRQYVSQPHVKAIDLEKKAGVPQATIGHILRDVHPRPERLGQLLRAVDDDTAISWLEAYLLDDVPEDWQARVRILIKEIQSANMLKEQAASIPMNDFDVAWQRLRAVISRDAELGQWFCSTVALVLGEPAQSNIVSDEALKPTKSKKPRGGGHPQDTNRLDPMPSQHAAQEHQEARGQID